MKHLTVKSISLLLILSVVSVAASADTYSLTERECVQPRSVVLKDQANTVHQVCLATGEVVVDGVKYPDMRKFIIVDMITKTREAKRVILSGLIDVYDRNLFFMTAISRGTQFSINEGGSATVMPTASAYLDSFGANLKLKFSESDRNISRHELVGGSITLSFRTPLH